MQNVVIDNIDFVNLDAGKYWAFPKSYSPEKRRELAKQYVMSGNYYGARKMDGIWLMIIYDKDGNFYVRTRTKTVNGDYLNKALWIPHICKELTSLPKETVLLGELYFPNNEGSRKVTSVFNCLKDKCLERQQKNGFLHFYCFDVLAYKGKNLINTPFEKRIDHYLNYELFDILNNNNYIEVAEYKDEQELWDLYGQILAEGGEGIVIQKKTAKYSPGKRPAHDSVKLKKEIANTIDAFFDGAFKPPTKEYSGKSIETWGLWINSKTGQKYDRNMYKEYINGAPVEPVTKPYYNGWAGAVSFSVMKDGKPTHITWISGLPDSIKADIVSNPEKLVGKVVEISAMMVECIDGEYSLRHAKVEQFRDDKTKEDCEWSQIEAAI